MRIAPLCFLLVFLTAADAGSILNLSRMDEAEQREKVRRDLKAAVIYREGLQSVVAFASSRPDLFPPSRQKGKRTLSRAQKEAIWSTWKTFLDYTLALDSLRHFHRDWILIKDEIPREESFLVAYCSFLSQYRFSLEWISRVEKDRSLDVLLNEPVPEMGLKKGAYNSLKLRFLNTSIAMEFAAMQAIYKVSKDEGVQQVHEFITEDVEMLKRMGRGKGELLTAKNALGLLQKSGSAAWYPIQANVSEWMGDTKVYRKGLSLISEEQIRALGPKLQPGDILLSRREWYVSNIGLPGFWSHAALYVGTAEERREYFNEPGVQQWLQSQGQTDGDLEAYLISRYPDAYRSSLERHEGHLPRVIEAISEGVSFTTIEHSADADSVAVLRPRLSKRVKAAAVVMAFHYSGRPYDFRFDFLTDSALVCTELVSKSYEPNLNFPLIEILGRKAIPANEIARQFDEDYGTNRQQLDFILFLDGYEKEKFAVIASLPAFRHSWKRPKWHVLVQQ